MISASSPVGPSLAQTLLALCTIESHIGNEKQLCDHVQARLARTFPKGAIRRFHDSLIVHANRNPSLPKVALVGHLDTVVTEHDAPPRVEGSRLYGLGAADMKSGLAVMIELVERLNLAALPCDLTLIFYEREEGPFNENRLGPILEAFDDLRQLDLAICLEPSDNEMQLGAMGSIQCTVKFHGRSAHSARPWQGDNAIYRAAKFLRDLETMEHPRVDLDGHVFSEVMVPTIIHGGMGRNVVPPLVDLNINYRFAPGQTAEHALERLTGIVGEHGTVHPTDLAPAGRPHANHPLVKHLATCGVTAVKTKQAWTDVARFDSVGVPGVNLGPGNSAQAHQRNEHTDLDLLTAGYGIFERFVTTLR